MTGQTANKFVIRTKLNRPPIGPDFVERPSLLERLEAYRQRPLTVVSAPPGYGKSMLVSSWLEASDCPNAWVSLDEGDNDLRLFLSYFLAGIQSIFPNFGRQTQAMVNASTLAPVTALVGRLRDQAELSGVLNSLYDLHLSILKVEVVNGE
jgi:LuxR family maltose regulon positive regulatory protein